MINAKLIINNLRNSDPVIRRATAAQIRKFGQADMNELLRELKPLGGIHLLSELLDSMKEESPTREIWVAGTPSFVGGADTELFHQILLWRRHNIAVHIVPNEPGCIMPQMQERLNVLGCIVHGFDESIFAGKTVVSFCNGVALKRLQVINQNPKNSPKEFIWFNCMTWTFDDEILAIKNGWITHLGFVSRYQTSHLLGQYSEKLPEMTDGHSKSVAFGMKGFPKALEYWPFFDVSLYRVFDQPKGYFGVGRISRADPGKFSEDCWRIFDRVLCPIQKKVFVLGISDDVIKKIGQPPASLDWAWWSAGGISADELYSKIDVLIHKTGGSRESYGRVVIEAMAHGVVPLVERDYAFPEMLPGELAELMCGSSEEMSFKASVLAFDGAKLGRLRKACRLHVEKVVCDEKRSLRGWV